MNTAFPVSGEYAEKKKGWKLLWGGASVPSVASGADPLAGTLPSAGAAPAMTQGQSSDLNVAQAKPEVSANTIFTEDAAEPVSEPAPKPAPVAETKSKLAALEQRG